MAASFSAEMAPPNYQAIAAPFERAVREEMTHWRISGVSVALVDDQEIVYAGGFGEAQRDSVLRCGSISKLFNAVAVMQLVEAGKLDLDAPLDHYGEDLQPVNPFTNKPPVTLRLLLCHRSGMIRESPAGGYFDDSEPGLAHMVASVPQATLVSAPNAETRYSNVGPSIAGRVIELVTGTRFERYQRDHILAPLGMSNSAWSRKDVPRKQVVPAYMQVAGPKGSFRRERAPVFDLGTIPAGNLYTTVDDLARFVMMLATEGRAGKQQLLKPQSLAAMFMPQSKPDAGNFGLGFMVGKFREHTLISHGGAVYGHSSFLGYLPESKIGVVILANEDIVNARVQKLANFALGLMLEAKLGEAPPAPAELHRFSARELAAFAGDYESQSFWARLEVKRGELTANISGQPTELTPVGPLRFLANSRLYESLPLDFQQTARGEIVGFEAGLARIGRQQFHRVPAETLPIPREWRKYIGSYGPAFIPLIVSERHGHLYAMTENLAEYRLTPLTREVFAFPPGLYTHEHLVFLTDSQGKPHSVDLANMILKRRR